MSLSSLIVKNREFYGASHQRIKDNIKLFNSVTKGALRLSYAGDKNQGDWSRETNFTTLGMVRSRNPYVDTAIANVTPAMGESNDVKVARGTNEFRWNSSDYKWSGASEATMRMVYGEQLGEQTVKDMVQVAVGTLVIAMAAQASIYTDTVAIPTWPNLTPIDAKRGDAADDIVCRIMHSKSYFDLIVGNTTNTQNLFDFGGVKVAYDALGKPIIVTDVAPLKVAGAPDKYYILGLTAGAANIELNDDYIDNEVKINGFENIQSSFQAEWSFNLNLMNFKWDMANGGHAPNSAALLTAGNWDPIFTGDPKQFPGVIGRFN